MAPTKAEIRMTYERIADSFATTRRSVWPEVRAFIESLPSGSRVLEVGCANGRHAKLLSQKDHRVVALDFSLRFLTIGREDARRELETNHISWVHGEATQLPFRDKCFDAGLCVAVIHHLPSEEDRIVALEELRRALRRAAPLMISAWARDEPRFQAFAAAREGGSGDVEVPWTMPDGTTVPRFYHLFGEGELERLIIESGLRGERFFLSAGNWFALARTDG